MENRESGERLRRYVKEHMARQSIDTYMELARRSDVGRDTLQAWFRGRRPTPQAGGKVAAVLGVTYYEMLKEFDGVNDDSDLETVFAAFEWFMRDVRAGRAPQEVLAEIERVRARSAKPPPNNRQGGSPTRHRKAS